ncbi:MAG: S-adenosylmethionine:tRNA ribosyltransferase-isomerase [Bacteroidota bacterium]
MDPRNIRSEDFTYELPCERIAKFPLEQRDASKLLCYRNGEIEDLAFSDLAAKLEHGDLLVFNRTKVIHARLLFEKPTGGVIEIFCLEPHDEPDPAIALQLKGTAVWRVLVGNLKRWKDPVLRMHDPHAGAEYGLEAILAGNADDSLLVRFSWNQDKTFAELIERYGRLPIPPYLGRDAEASDELRYQTVYADREGSVAAPTAGLHFTESVFDSLEKAGVSRTFVTLHVGAGTFKPLKSETIGGHLMHEERIDVDLETISTLIRQIRSKKRIIAVGTTSMRTLESLYWLGVSVIKGEVTGLVDQWTAYDSKGENISALDALESLELQLVRTDQEQLHATTRIIIVPGYEFKMVDGLVTNFHQPSSTLLLLVGALVGDDWKKIYNHALTNGYRFLSYGDSSLLIKSV